jgi:hypothetical protein
MGGFHGGSMGGFHGGTTGGFHGGFNNGFHGGFNNGFRGGFNRGFNRFGIGFGFYGGYWPYWGWGGYWDPYWYGYGSYGYPYYSAYYPDYSTYYPYYPTASVVPAYPQTYQQPSYSAPQAANPGYRDEYGQSRDVNFLLAFKDGSIKAVIAYWANGDTLHYVTRDHQEHNCPLDGLDRQFSARLNRDQHVPFNLP